MVRELSTKVRWHYALLCMTFMVITPMAGAFEFLCLVIMGYEILVGIVGLVLGGVLGIASFLITLLVFCRNLTACKEEKKGRELD